MAVILFDTELCADCVECDERGRIAVGTYQLTDGMKSGRIHVFQNSLENRLYSVDTDAILDMKWVPSTDDDTGSLMCATNSRGIALLKDTNIEYSSSIPRNEVYLSLDISGPFVYTSTNLGNVNIHNSDDLALSSSFHAHDYEVWTASVCSNLLFTGSDDAMFKCWDMRTKTSPLFLNKEHSAGVCSIIEIDDNTIATGSYDKRLVLWDLRSMFGIDSLSATKPKILNSMSAKSGVWRLKRISNARRILAACMYDGFYVLDFPSLQIIEHRSFDNSLSYGCTYMPGNTKTIFTCTFYNKQAQEWNVNE